MKLQKKVTLSVTLPVILMLLAGALAMFYYVNRMATDNAREKGLIVVRMAKTAILKGTSGKKGHVLNNGTMMNAFRNLPGLREVRIIRGNAVIKQFGAGDRTSLPEEDVEKRMLNTAETSTEIADINGRQVLHFSGPLFATNDKNGNCMQCHHVAEGEVLGGLSVQVDLTHELHAAHSLLLIAMAIVGLFSIIIIVVLRRFTAPIVTTTHQLAEAMSRGARGDFAGRLKGIPKNSKEIKQIVNSTNHFFDVLETNIGGITNEVEILIDMEKIGSTRTSSDENTLIRAKKAVDLMLQAARLKSSLESDRNLNEVFTRIRNVLKRDYGLKRFGIYEALEANHALQPVIMEGMPEGWSTWCDRPADSNPEACRATRSGQIVDSRVDLDACPHFCNACQSISKNIKHYCIPINDSGGSSTLLMLVFDEEDSELMNEKIMLIRYISKVITPEIRSKRLLRTLRDSTVRDPLTGLFNRRFLEEVETGIVSSVLRRKSSLGVLMCDIDHFKKVNDTYGHETGDTVIKGIAEIFKKELRTSDYVVRYGGEEILALLVDANEEKSLEIAERIRSKVENKTFKASGVPFCKTISIGVSVFPNDGMQLMEAVKNADTALYSAKDTGRNRVIRYQDGGEETTGNKAAADNTLQTAPSPSR